MNIKRISQISIFLSLAIVISIIENMIPISNIIPGMKIGLANVIIVIAVYIFTPMEAFSLSIIRVLIVAILRTGLFSINFFFSISGAVLSITAMLLIKKTKLSIIGISVIGAIMHSIGQILIAIIILKTSSIIWYLPVLLIVSILSGIFIGMIAKQIIKYINKETNY